MKKSFYGIRKIFSLLSVPFALFIGTTCLASFHPEQYTELKIIELKATPEEYKYKKVCFITVYEGFHTTFHNYIEKSGFKPSKDFYIKVKPYNFPVMADKRKFSEIVTTLKQGSAIKVYGRVKKFSSTPKYKGFPRYYLDLEQLETVQGEKPQKSENAEEQNDSESEKKPAWRRKVRNWNRSKNDYTEPPKL